jgi:hypothetical protein
MRACTPATSGNAGSSRGTGAASAVTVARVPDAAWSRRKPPTVVVRPVKAFIDSLDEEAAVVVAAMKEIAAVGLPAARHLRDDI